MRQSTDADNTVIWQNNTISHTLFHHDSSNLMGGLQVFIENGWCTPSFTLEFRDIAANTSYDAMSTTEHCSETVGDDWYQGPNPILTSYGVANTTVVADTTPCNILDNSGAGMQQDNCTIGDQSYANVSAGSSLSNGHIFKPDAAPVSHDDALNIPKIQYFTGDRATDRFQIVSARSPIVGDMVHKVGRTTGWTSGVIQANGDPTCPGGFLGLNDNRRHDPPSTETYIECKSWVQENNLGTDLGVAGGDSGSPVFVRTGSADDVILVGVIFGESGYRGTFVPIDRVYAESLKQGYDWDPSALRPIPSLGVQETLTEQADTGSTRKIIATFDRQDFSPTLYYEADLFRDPPAGSTSVLLTCKISIDLRH